MTDPTKEGYKLNIDVSYYNKLDIDGFSHMMKDPSYCYKFYWLEAIVQLISRNVRQTTFASVYAWAGEQAKEDSAISGFLDRDDTGPDRDDIGLDTA
ncbi:MAG: hypothetical protein Q4E57_05195 [Eubacteriales bacterium]|nr:hypothetical protein [Eubacteriales bacterium]